ncbi:MAG: DUF4142 domain-containing protein [Alphaproteobacteria bacterium]|nr:DUF4142 domain-containing protein [Alphaproteobacteria bacterium]
MPRSISVWLTASALALAAFGYAAEAETTPPADMRATAPKAPVTDSTAETSDIVAPMKLSTTDYVKASGLNNLFEITACQIALERSRNAEVRAYAEGVAKAHARNEEDLKPLATAAGATPPAALDAIHQDLVARLKAASASGFDAMFVQQQIFGHERVLAAHRIYSASGADAALRQFAADTAKAVESHLQSAKSLQGKVSEKAASTQD